MRIGVDAHVLSGKFQGSRTYLLNLYQHVLMQPHAQRNDYTFLGHWQEELPFGNEVKYVNFKSESKIKRLVYETSPLLEENNIELYHTTYISPLQTPCNTVVTIHDILFETHPQYFNRQEVLRNKWLVRRSAKKAKQIHTISEYSRHALVTLYGIPEDKIKIVPNGVNLDTFSPENKEAAARLVAEKYGVQNYLLTVGRIEPRKNHIALLKAYRQLKAANIDCGKLVIVGKPDFKFKPFFDLLKELNLSNDVLIIDSVNDAMLPLIYRAARIFLYPSFAEGFGIPPLEAMASGVPVISSNTTAIPEVIGEAGILIDPNKPEQIAAAVVELLERSDKRAQLIHNGLLQCEKWTWGNAAEAFHSAIKQIKP